MEQQRQAYLYALIVVLLWATVASAFKISLRYLSFFPLVLFASIVSTIVLLLILTLQGKFAMLFQYSRRQYVASALLGLLNPFLYYIVLFKAYSLLPAQQAQPLNQTWAIVLPLLSILILKQRIAPKSIIAILISFVGVVLISTQGRILNLRFTSTPGVLLALGSAFVWALFWLGNVRDRRDDVAKLFLNFLSGSLFLILADVLFLRVALPSGPGLLGAAYVGLIEMGIAFVLWLKALRLSRTTAQVSNMVYLVPFLSLVVINFAVGEKIHLSTLVGLMFIVAGILIQQRSSKQLNARSP